ncbi:MAG: hypothetical protein Q9170_002196 [Blastenia crenularia]
MVVVLPQAYIQRRSDAKRHKFGGFRAYWILHQLPAFPPEYAPFILPLTRLGETLAILRSYIRGEIQNYFNPYNRVYFIGMPVPERAPVGILLPEAVVWKNALKPIHGQQEAFFLTRDTIPVGWWNDFSDRWLDWPSESLDNVRDCCINLGSPEQAVLQIEAILWRMQRALGTMKARSEIPVTIPDDKIPFTEPGTEPPSDNADGDEDTDLDEGYEENRWTSLDPWKGLGSRDTELRLPTTEVWQCERLLELCRRCHGLVFDVGRKNSACRWGAVDYIWSPTDTLRYDTAKEIPRRVWHFDPQTPIIPITFAEAEWIVGKAPRGIRHSLARMPEHDSIVVLDLYTPYSVRLSHGRLVIPSQLLKFGGYSNYYSLAGDAQFNDFLVDEDEILDTILALAHCPRPAYSGLTRRDYVKSIGEVLQQGLAGLISGVDEGDK